jgi:DNA-binding MarR family transcriptional regulator
VQAPRARGRGSLFNDLLTAHRYALLLIDRELAADRVDPDLYWLIARIRELEPVSPTQIARISGVGRTTLRDAIGRLVARGEVTREPNPEDSRSYLLRLTSEGRRRFRAGGPALRRAVGQLQRELEIPYADAQRVMLALRDALQATVGDDVDPAAVSVDRRTRPRVMSMR